MNKIDRDLRWLINNLEQLTEDLKKISDRVFALCDKWDELNAKRIAKEHKKWMED